MKNLVRKQLIHGQQLQTKYGSSSSTKGVLKHKTSSPKQTVRFVTYKRTHQTFLKIRLEVQPNPEGAT